MSRFVWSKEFELGIDIIDHQHQRIVDYINQIYDISLKAQGTCGSVEVTDADTADLKAVLASLVDYTLSHLAFEEALMEEAEYPELSEHQLVHRQFSELIGSLKARFDQGEEVSQRLASVLQHWLIEHIMTEDKRYAELVKHKLLGIEPDKHRHWVQQALSRHFQ
ncbi:bacteriohemerythrin [Aestuariicella hydrocarbonica]|uniref:Bacteriohemerythrin n=1 Tax=Pseudomaricurvus hydrocarbonicus TaxID=1470433 RepID=A0A9E5MPA4_9GAMM|nr:bacteriohemerythrin [Aestuariicella hydrocarbonica]NHO67946.1 bacteriohemerythrin [Aestuariicella hydrocarbonica]